MAIEQVRWSSLDGHDADARDLDWMVSEWTTQIEERFRAVTFKAGSDSNGIASGFAVAAITDAVVVGNGTAYDSNTRSQISVTAPVTLDVVAADAGKFVVVEIVAIALPDDPFIVHAEAHPITGFQSANRLIHKSNVVIRATGDLTGSEIKLCKIVSHTLGKAPVLNLEPPDRKILALGTIGGQITATPFLVVAADNTGDYKDVQSAIDALPNTGGMIFVKPGEYVVTKTIKLNKKGVRLIGGGPATRIIGDIQKITENRGPTPADSKGALAFLTRNNGILHIAPSAADIVAGKLLSAYVGHMTFDWKDPDGYSGFSPFTKMITLEFASGSVLDCLVFRNTPKFTTDLEGVTSLPEPPGLFAGFTSPIVVEDCHFVDIDKSVTQAGSDGGGPKKRVVGNTMVGVTTFGVGKLRFNAKDWVIQGNIMRGAGGNPRSSGVEIIGSSGNVVVGNVIRDFGNGVAAPGLSGLSSVNPLDINNMIFGNACVYNDEYGSDMGNAKKNYTIGNVLRKNGLGNVRITNEDHTANVEADNSIN
jgi:hypothetical protein